MPRRALSQRILWKEGNSFLSILIRREAAQLEPSVSIQSQVKTYLTDTGRKKKWLASRLGVSPTTLSQWLAGKSAFSDQRLREILDIIQSNA